MPKILIVEDDESLRDVYREEFESEGFIVETANDGHEGVERMAFFLPEVVLLDLMMPKMSGFDVLKSVKNNPELKNIPVIVLTNINPDVTDLMKNWGAAGFLLKADNTPEQVVGKVREVLKI
jgi:CheY-like chemotaxis protein